MRTTNRREFFRVKTHVSIEILPFTAHHHSADENKQHPTHSTTSIIEQVAECFNLPPVFNLMAEFQRIELENKQLLRQIVESDRRVGVYLKMLNKKVDTLAQAVIFSDISVDASTILDLDLSEGGIAMETSSSYKKEALLAVKLILLPARTALLLKAKVLSSTRIGVDTFELHIEFEDIDDHQRQLIARHLIRLQAANNKRQI